MSISIALAVFNEEKNIARCLQALYDWVDEIVVVDGGSTDKTIDIIKKLDKEKKVTVIVTDNPPMFHKNKQKALEACTKEWILQLDADEIVSAELKLEIQEIIAGKGEAVAYWIPRLNYFLGRSLRKGGQYPDKTIRLYKNGVAKFPCKSVHEQVAIDGKIGHLKSDLLHYPYETFDKYIQNGLVRYSILEADVMEKQGVRPSALNFLKYFLILPKWWFLKTFFRHKGFVDGFPGFVFSAFSALRYWFAYIILYENLRSDKK
ncbi:hypothetical protein A3F34_01385 [Candidatus Roizmanbacteria bacterium RIFCSPHIGHO2_12_FULL_44_10]|uniref:Glycosyltransferase 2-like domain-containing protein n=1 Tax=Candidatus Roizmanbacteria bacterium RIFCSPHIGHO2_12_FULL_44_10 TaxID=1802054 RepID=A0A1F7I6M6_9BACT|nr:MAG: hypothetical protein A3F34_01385 [Candidatus Roizmanbacteria bacterium RIFCSPHIGHO2_12_FULL_44_10]